MLKLDEKKIRKGRPVGLPYQGSKKKISKKIVGIIEQNFGTDKPVYDIFGGGGAITAECMLNGIEVHYNDLYNTITDMFQKVISEDREYLKTLIVSRKEFFEIREKENKKIDDELKLLVNSFGNNRKSYLYSKEMSDLKYNLALEIIKQYNTFDNYRKTEIYLEQLQLVKQSEQLQQLQQLKQLQQLQQLEQLGRLQQLAQLRQLQQFGQVKTTNLDYKEFSMVENSILYLDPPYENTLLIGYSMDEFHSQALYDWAYDMSKNNIVLISSYEISDERFECVYEFKTARSTYSSGTRDTKTEKLFMAKK